MFPEIFPPRPRKKRARNDSCSDGSFADESGTKGTKTILPGRLSIKKGGPYGTLGDELLRLVKTVLYRAGARGSRAASYSLRSRSPTARCHPARHILKPRSIGRSWEPPPPLRLGTGRHARIRCRILEAEH
jgi:hypothetical protein